MKLNKIFVVAAAMLLTTTSFAQRYEKSGDKVEEEGYTVYKLNYGNRCWTLDPYGIYSFQRGEFGGGAQLKYFVYGWSFGLDGYYLRDASSVSAFVGYRFTGPRSPIHFDLSLGGGFTQQLQYKKAANALIGDVTGNLNVSGKWRSLDPSAFAEAALEIPLGKKKWVALRAFARLQYLPFEGIVRVGDFPIEWNTDGDISIDSVEITPETVTTEARPFDYLVGISLVFRLK